MAKVIYVNANINGGNDDGTSWSNAYTSFLVAINSAVYGDSIWVAQGIYKPTQTSFREFYFHLKDGIKWFGGFQGIENNLSERNLEQFPTVLSGDINNIGDSTDNSYHVVYAVGVDSTTIIDGFNIEEGFAEHKDPTYFGHYDYGGGMLVDANDSNLNIQIQIRNCTFKSNFGLFGGALSIGQFGDNFLFTPRIENCKFINNHSVTHGGAIHQSGGQINGSLQLITDCIFTKNISNNHGGAIYFHNVSNELRFDNCDFLNNQAASGGGVFFELIYKYITPIVFSNCTFDHNIASNGAGIHFSVAFNLAQNEPSGFTIENSHFVNNQQNGGFSEAVWIEMAEISDSYKFIIKDTDFINNENYGINMNVVSNNPDIELLISSSKFIGNGNSLLIEEGAGLSLNPNGIYHSEIKTSIINTIFEKNNTGLQIRSNNLSKISNCLFLKNKKHSISNKNSLDITNSIFWEELPLDEIFFKPLSSPSLENYNIQHSLLSTPDCIIDGIDYCGEGMIFNTYPMFRDTTNGDFSIHSCSPAINAGENATIDSLDITFDKAGNPRIIDEAVDMGPYETQAFEVLVPQTTDVSCTGENDGAFSWVQHGTPPFIYEWVNGTTSEFEFNNLPADIYYITITDTDNCVDTLEIEVEEPTPLTLDGTITPVSTSNGMDGAIDLKVEGGTPLYNYLWSTGIETVGIEGLSAGIYSVTVTDAKNCITVDSFEVGTSVSTIFPKEAFQAVIQPNIILKGEGVSLVFQTKERIIFEIVMLDEMGREIWKMDKAIAKGHSKIEVPNIKESGIYFVQLTNEQRKHIVLKLVVN